MTPTEIRDLLSAACPELTWEIDGKFVVAKEVASFVRVSWSPILTGRWADPNDALRVTRHNGGIFSIGSGVPDPELVAIGICDVLHDDVLNAASPAPVEARRLCLRVRIQSLRMSLQSPVNAEFQAQDIAALAKAEAEAARLAAPGVVK